MFIWRFILFCVQVDKMKKTRLVFAFAAMVFLLSVLKVSAISNPLIPLTDSEQAWIKAHPIISCAPDPDFPPIEFFDTTGQYRGLVADYLDIILPRVGLEKKIVRLNDWRDVLEQAKEKKIDLLTAACRSVERDAYLDFSTPFIEVPAVIIVRQRVTLELTLDQLKGMKVSVVSKYAAHDYIAQNYPYLDLDLVPDIQTGLRKVSFGMVDAMVANIATVSYYIEKGTITNLKVSGESGFTYKLCFAPIKGLPILTGILNKGLASLTAEEKRSIYNKWIHLEQTPTLSRTMQSVFIIILGIVLLVIVLVVGWNRSLRIIVAEKTKELKKEAVRHEQAKEKIAETENRYRGIFEHTKSGVIVCQAVRNGEDFIVLDANTSVQKIDKLRPEEILGKSILDIFPGIRDFGLFGLMQEVWNTSVPSHLPPTLYKDNRIQGWRDFLVYKLPSNEIVMVYSDETSRITAQIALRDSEEKLSGIIHSIHDHMVMLDSQLTILWANRTAKKLFGDHIENQKCYTIFAGLDHPCEDCIAKKCFSQGRMQEREMNLKNENGLNFDFWETSNTASFDQTGRPRSVVTIFRNITQKKALEAEAMRSGHLASIGELASGVAHEINNPINSIINLAQIISNEDNKKGSPNDMALRIISEGKRIANIVSSLLTFAKEKKGPETPMALEDILTETLALTKVHMDKHGIRLEIDIAPGLPMILGHMQKIQQVFLNIINNARYALNQKALENNFDKILKITGRKKIKKDHSFVRIIFEDNGTGITDKILGRVMDPFFSTKPSGQGTGLGLSISHGIISNHGGYMKILSRENEYTRVVIDLPAGDKS